MQLAVDVSLSNILSLISQMSLNEIEEVKNKIVEKELYFKKFKKDKIENIIDDFQKEDYSADFLKDLENGLKRSSIYNEN
jgi:threonyl-tRNA synthetase